MNKQSLDFAKAFEGNEDQFAKVDYNKLNDVDEEEINLVSAPLLWGIVI